MILADKIIALRKKAGWSLWRGSSWRNCFWTRPRAKKAESQAYLKEAVVYLQKERQVLKMEKLERTGCRVLSRDAIKYIAMFTMLLNHISNVFMRQGTFWAEVFLDIGYFTAPVMCWFLVEGYDYTRSKKKYALRLVVFAALSEIPFCLAFTTNGVISFYGMNMIFTLLLCFGILAVKEKLTGSAQTAAIVGLFLLSVFSDWALLAPGYTLLFRWAKGSPKREKQAFAWAILLFGLMNLAGVPGRPFWMNILCACGAMAGVALAAVAILCLYNGKRASHGRIFSKWFFYLFYPAHLLVLGLLRLALL